jgi:hypothetical protein
MPHLSRLLAAICAITVILAFATLLLVGAAAPAQADVTLRTPVAEAGYGGAVTCAAVNIGKTPIEVLRVAIIAPSGETIVNDTCFGVYTGGFCFKSLSGPTIDSCRITYEGSRKAVRGTLQVIDANGSSVLSLEAR